MHNWRAHCSWQGCVRCESEWGALKCLPVRATHLRAADEPAFHVSTWPVWYMHSVVLSQASQGFFFCCCYACLLSCAVTHELQQENRSVNNPFHSFSLEPEPNDRLNDNYADCCRVTWYGHIYYQNWVFPGNDFAQVVSHPDPTETRQLHFTTKLSQAVNTTAIVWTSISSLIWMIPVLVLRLIHWKQSIN